MDDWELITLINNAEHEVNDLIVEAQRRGLNVYFTELGPKATMPGDFTERLSNKLRFLRKRKPVLGLFLTVIALLLALLLPFVGLTALPFILAFFEVVVPVFIVSGIVIAIITQSDIGELYEKSFSRLVLFSIIISLIIAYFLLRRS